MFSASSTRKKIVQFRFSANRHRLGVGDEPRGGGGGLGPCWLAAGVLTRACSHFRLAAVEGSELQEFIDRYNAAWNAHDVEAIVSMHTHDSVFENHTTGDVNIGKDAIANAITGIFAVFPDLSFEARSQYIRDDLVIQEWTARGTHEGPMTRSGIKVEPTGRKVEYRGMDIIPIRDGLVARKDVYSDGVTLLRQLGLTEIA
jgi:steroid delta-isomerase-like uncharacterized protein